MCLRRLVQHTAGFPAVLRERDRVCKLAGLTVRYQSTKTAPQLPRMDYQDAIYTLNTLQTNASALEQVRKERSHPQAQLQAMRSYLERASLTDEALDHLNIIHVTGTKGKGSTCAFTERILRGYGFRTGFYSSPHLVQVRERIRINGQPIGKDLFTKYFWQVYRQLDETKDAHGGAMPAYFRFLTILAFHIFLQEKPGVPAFTVKQPEDAMAVLRDRAKEIKCPLWVCPELERYQTEPLCLGLAGQHQRLNASLALQLNKSFPTTNLENSSLPRASSFKLSPFMVKGLAETEWPGRNQTLKHGALTYFLDGAHTMRSMQACVQWFREAAAQHERNASGPVARVLLFNATGERDSAAMLKLLVPCRFDFAVFCPNITEAIDSCNADQQNFNVSVENMLTRCLDNESSWHLHTGRGGRPGTELHIARGLLPAPERRADSLVFPCILSALQWIAQGRDSVLGDAAGNAPAAKPSAAARAGPLREAAHIHVLVTGSLHLVGGVLKHLDPESSNSPHLVQIRERIRINGQPIGKELFAKYFFEVFGRLEKTKDAHKGTMPSYFGFLTILAFHVFLEEKPGVPAFTVRQPGDALAVLHDRAKEIQCPLWVCPPLEDYQAGGGPLNLSLTGQHQRLNASLALQLSSTWLQKKSELGLADTHWPGRGQTLKRGAVTYFLDGAHTMLSIQACVRWFEEATAQHERNTSGSTARVLLFTVTGQRDSAPMLKLLLPCGFDFAVFCPIIPDATAPFTTDQMKTNEPVEDMLARCSYSEESWRLHSGQGAQGGLLVTPEKKADTLIFPCILSALQWITQGRDSVLEANHVFPAEPSITAKAAPLREATSIHVLVTGSLYLVGGVLKHLHPLP
ncbi:unnamed protein product [Menidia menidia]|uniref:tetrahydrofolate synthase n=1 Tax=Menidia menidia TaxID=238744 RepID=A0A8S4ALK2_9TELE|nr:unnamed protein product [Menidia menidia]